jgi:hypothetical protein
LSNQSISVLAYRNNSIIFFDDTHPLQLSSSRPIKGTVELKAHFIRDAHIAGVLVHTLDMDDYTGVSCQHSPFPITSLVYSVIASSIAPGSSRIALPTERLSPCLNSKTNDLVADELDCRFYYVCIGNNKKIIPHLQCPNNMHFSSEAKACIEAKFVSLFFRLLKSFVFVF